MVINTKKKRKEIYLIFLDYNTKITFEIWLSAHLVQCFWAKSHGSIFEPWILVK